MKFWSFEENEYDDDYDYDDDHTDYDDVDNEYDKINKLFLIIINIFKYRHLYKKINIIFFTDLSIIYKFILDLFKLT